MKDNPKIQDMFSAVKQHELDARLALDRRDKALYRLIDLMKEEMEQDVPCSIVETSLSANDEDFLSVCFVFGGGLNEDQKERILAYISQYFEYGWRDLINYKRPVVTGRFLDVFYYAGSVVEK